MSEHNLILEFYKPTYNLDFNYDGDGGLDLHFTNIKGEFFMTMNDSYNSVYIEDEDCEFSKGEMFATVDLGDLVERIISGEFRQTNGKAVSDWGKRFIGDGEEQIEFNGKNYADGSLFWDDFFKEMPKDEIKDFMTFCEDYLYLPNIEVDTVSNKWDFENGKVELKSNDKWGIGISDDYNIISVDEFTCDSADAFVAYDVASSESDEDDFYESKKSAKRSLKEGISAFNKAIAKKYNETEPNGAGQYYLDWRFDLHDEKDNIEAIADRCGVTVEFQSDEGYFEVFEESKKYNKRSLKESVDGKFATDEECNMGGKGWILEGTYNFIMEFLEEWGIAPTDVIPQKHDMLALYNADGNVFGYCHHDDEVDIFVVDKDINYFWKNYKPSTKRVKVTEMDDNGY